MGFEFSPSPRWAQQPSSSCSLLLLPAGGYSTGTSAPRHSHELLHVLQAKWGSFLSWTPALGQAQSPGIFQYTSFCSAVFFFYSKGILFMKDYVNAGEVSSGKPLSSFYSR